MVNQNEIDSKFWEARRLMGLQVYHDGFKLADLLVWTVVAFIRKRLMPTCWSHLKVN